jgi:outer membrane protein TolC
MLSLILIPAHSTVQGEPAPTNDVFLDLTLDQFIQWVAERNEQVQMKVAAFEASRQNYLAEKGAFEPEFFGSASKEALNRQNTVQEERNQLSATFEEDNTIYQTGVEGQAVTGARLRLGYTLRDLRNSLQDSPSFLFRAATNGEYQTFFGLTLTQPLLKNGGVDVNRSRIRIAAQGSRIAFQEYRKQTTQVLSSAEAAYWRLYLLQEQLRFLRQSVATAETILNDSKILLDAGRGSELDVMEAEAGLALRRSLLMEAEQKLRETSNLMASLSAERLGARQRLIRATTEPALMEERPGLADVYARAYQFNPDYQMQVEKAARDGIALGYLRNQRLPELNLKGNYGLSGLGESTGDSWDELASGDWPAWSVGLEFRIPIGGGARARGDYAAAKFREQESLLGLRAIETEMLNSLESAVNRIEETRSTTSNYQAQVSLREAVLSAALSRLEVGKIESRRLLEIEADLLETQGARVEAMVNHQNAIVALHALEGSLLARRNLDLSQKDLENATASFARAGGMSREEYAQLMRQAHLLQESGGQGLWPEEKTAFEDRRREVERKLEKLDRITWDAAK